MAVPPRRPLYIIVMSSLSDDQKLAEALDCGADDLIAKEIQRNAVIVAARQLAAEFADVEVLALFEVPHGYGEMKDVARVTHDAGPQSA